MSDFIRIAIVDDHPIVRAGLFRIISKNPGFKIVAEGECADDALRIAREYSPDIIVLDISMPGGGLNAARDVKTHCPKVKVVMLTVSEGEQHLSQALANGASGYILKGVLGSDLLNSLALVHSGQPFITPHLAARLLTRQMQMAPVGSDPDGEQCHALTKSEETTLNLVTTGRTNKEIAREIGVSEAAIKGRLTKIMKKLKVRNRMEAAMANSHPKATVDIDN